MSHLDALESESIFILREAYNRFDRLAMLWSLRATHICRRCGSQESGAPPAGRPFHLPYQRDRDAASTSPFAAGARRRSGPSSNTRKNMISERSPLNERVT
jgi:hypothetical protein